MAYQINRYTRISDSTGSTSKTSGALIVDGGIASGENIILGGYLGITGTTNTVSIKVFGSTTAYNFNLPVDAGTSGTILTSGGGGASNMTWKATTGSGDIVLASGPTFGISGITVTGKISGNGGALLNNIQNSVDGTSDYGLKFWSDSNWAIYYASSGSLKSFANGTATTGPFTGSALRLRVANVSTGGLIVENSGESNLFSVRGDTGIINIPNLTPSSAVATDASDNLISVANTGTGNNVLSTSPTLVTPILGAASATSLSLTNPLTTGNGGTGLTTIGTNNQVLTSNGTSLFWANAASSGVTSVAATVPSFLSISGSPITTTGTLAITLSGTALPVSNGGTGITTIGANNQVLTSNGTSLFWGNLSSGSPIFFSNVGIGTSSPNAPLQFANTIVNRKIVLYEVGNDDHQFSGFGISNSLMRYQLGNTSSDHVFFSGVNSTTSNELFRIKGNGDVSLKTSITISGTGTGTPGSVYLSDTNKGIQYSGTQNGTNHFNSNFPSDGIAVFGWTDGTLGTKNGGNKCVLNWNNSGNVGIGTTTVNSRLNILNNVTHSGGSGDWTNITNNVLTIQDTANLIRINHLSADGGNAVVYNYQTGKTVHWGEPSDTGVYSFRGRNVSIQGSLSKGSGSFDIQHPLSENENDRLIHSFVEGPRCDNIYRGKNQLINGTITINLDKECVENLECGMKEGTFVALNKNPTVYLQNNNSFYRIRGTINGNILTIICENTQSNDTIDWMVIGERKDSFIKKWERTDSDGCLITEYTRNT